MVAAAVNFFSLFRSSAPASTASAAAFSRNRLMVTDRYKPVTEKSPVLRRLAQQNGAKQFLTFEVRNYFTCTSTSAESWRARLRTYSLK